MGSQFTWPVRVYYEDTDAGGVVYHANYLRFMERARSEWLRDMGYPVERIVAEENKQFVLRSAEMSFIKPARLGDDLVVSVEVTQTKNASMRLEQKVSRLSGEADDTLVTAYIELAMVNCENFRPVRLSSFLSDKG